MAKKFVQVFHDILWKNLEELFGQPNIYPTPAGATGSVSCLQGFLSHGGGGGGHQTKNDL